MDAETYHAVGELMQAAAHQHGIVGPVAFEVLTPRDYPDTDIDTNNIPRTDAAGFEYGDFFYARH